MSFVPGAFADRPLRTREQVMEVLVSVADALDMPDKRGACICAGMCVAQEAGSDEDGDDIPEFWCPWNRADPESFQYEHDSEGDDGRSVGYFQQQKSSTGALWWGPTSQEMDLRSAATEFMRRLKKAGYDASNARTANDSVQRVQGSGRPDAYAKHWQLANDVYDNVVRGAPASGGGQVGWSGDPVWLPDVLRDEGLRCDVPDGAFGRGHGDFGDIWGVVCHHTGNNNASWQSIAFHPELGLASQLHLSREGVYTLCGVGIAWHAGNGSWPGLPTNGANQRTIGIEAANDGGGTPGKPHHIPWPDVQYDAYVRGVSAIMRKLGYDSSHAIGHKDWAGAAQGKWDPGGIDMNLFRADVQRRIFPPVPGKDPLMGVNIDRLNLAVDKLLATSPERNIYRDDDEDHDDTVGKIWSTYGMTREMVVEHEALMGEVGSILKVKRLADGKGPGAKDQWAIDRAKGVLAKAMAANPQVKL